MYGSGPEDQAESDTSDSPTVATPIAEKGTTQSHTLPTVATPAKAALRKQAVSFGEDTFGKIFSTTTGAPVAFTLPDGKSARGTVDHRELSEKFPDAGYIQGRLTFPQPGFFFFQRQSMPGVAGDVVGFIRFDEGNIAYRVDPSPAGPVLALHTVSDVFCAQLAPPVNVEAAELPEEHPDPAIPGYQNGVVPLQSLPGGEVVLYIDFDGEEGPHAGWGDFDAAAPSVTNSQIRDVWERVAEDFAPFNINVTTDLQVYLDAPENSRQRCIVTPTTDASPGDAGVAIVGSFNSTGDIPCWAFYASGKIGAEIISHELGHTLNLAHDGRTSPAEGYYAGHGSGNVGWAPIMGTGYFKNLTQWSKGEYLNAYESPTVPQDDLAIITEQNNDIDYRTDDHGEDLASASYLRIDPDDDSVESDGVIETSTDVDAFRFTLTSGGTVSLNAKPVSDGPNLDIKIGLYDDGGNHIVSDDPSAELFGSITRFLSAGTYTFRVTGTAPGDELGTGYTDYASLGFYSITGTVPNAKLPQRFEVAENAPIDDIIDDVIPQNVHDGDIYFSIDSGNDLDIFYIDEEEGTLYVNDNSLLDFEALTSGYERPEFELFIVLEDDEDEELNEYLHVIISVLDLNEPPQVDPAATFVLENTSPGTQVHKVLATDPDYGDAIDYAITGGNSSGAFAIDPDTGVISVTGPVTADTLLDVTVTDSQSSATQTTVDFKLVSVSGAFSAGSIQQTYFENIAGTAVSDFITDPRFPDFPDSENALYNFSTGNHGDDYGSTIRGYLIPPITGDYTFWLASDDAGQLLISQDSNTSPLTQTNSVSGSTGPQEWNTPSAPVSLVKGQPYYIELRYKEGDGADHASVAWEVTPNTGPAIPKQLIPGKYLAPFLQNYAPKVEQASFSIQADAYASTPVGTVVPTDVNVGDTHSGFTIVSGNSSGAFAIDPDTGEITIAVRNAVSVGQLHNLEIQVTDSGTPPLAGSSSIDVEITSPTLFNPGGIIQEVWDSIYGDLQITTLTSDPRYPLHPTESRIFNGGFESDADIGNDYGSRIRAYIVPPATGEYVFYICSDDNGQLFLSEDDSPENASLVADVPGWATQSFWTKYDNQATNNPNNPNGKTINLVAGQRYYIETLHREAGGRDHVQVAWERPDISGITIIDQSFLVPYNPNTAPVWDQSRYVFSIDTSVTAGHQIGSVTATDFDPITYAIITNNNGAFAIDSTGMLTVADPNMLVPGRSKPIIGAQDAGNGGLYPFESSTIQVEIVVTDGGNLAPLAFPITYQIPTTSPIGTVVGEAPFRENNEGDILFFSLDTTAPFEIDEASGRITVAGQLDPQNVTSYTLPFTVTDAGGLSAQDTVSVELVVPIDSDADSLADVWELEFFGDITLYDAQDDPDGDKLTNFYELAFGSNPTFNDESDQNTVKLSEIPGSNDMFLTYRRPQGYFELGLVYQIFASDDLTTWHFPEMDIDNVVHDPDGVTEWVTMRIVTPPDTKYFLRVNALQQSGEGGG